MPASRDEPPRLIVMVDTEEEFDWTAPLFDRGAIGVSHMRRIGVPQAVFDAHGVRPVYRHRLPDRGLGGSPSTRWRRSPRTGGR